MHVPFFQNARFLIVDDESPNISILTQMLKQWNVVNIVSTTQPEETVALLQAFQPDIILLDLMMPKLNGFEVMEQLKSCINPDNFLPILALTADTTGQAKVRALTLGASDFLTKPFDATELSLRIHNLLSRRFLHRRLQDQNRVLDHQVQERTEQLASSERETAICLSVAGEYRDDDTGLHTHRVGATSAILARYCEQFNEEKIDLISQAAPLHDIGKNGVSDSILLKPGRLTLPEFEIMKTHCVIGYSILSRHHTPLLQLAANIALCHHERWDGGGYPSGLKGENIPLEGRIVAIADVFDALTHKRPYKEAWPVEKAIAEIQAQAGTQFDPNLVEVFSTHLPTVLEARSECPVLSR